MKQTLLFLTASTACRLSGALPPQRIFSKRIQQAVVALLLLVLPRVGYGQLMPAWQSPVFQSSVGEHSRVVSTATDKTGNLLVLVANRITGSSNTRSTLYKLNAAGEELWSASLNNPDAATNEQPKVMVLDASDNVYVLSQLQVDHENAGGTLTKYGVDGHIRWSEAVGTAAAGMVSVADMLLMHGHLYLTGTGWRNGKPEIVTRRMNLAGQALWEKRHPGGSARKIAADIKQNVLVAGAVDNGRNLSDVALLNYKAGNGKELFSRSYNYRLEQRNSSDVPADLHVTPSGDILVLSNTTPLPYVYNVVLMKTDRNGNEQWHTLMGNTNESIYKDAAFDKEGSVILMGTELKYRQTADHFLTKYNTQGQRLWYNTFNTYDGNMIRELAPMAVALDAAGNIAITGHKAFFPAPPAVYVPPVYLEQPTFISLLFSRDGVKTWEHALESITSRRTYGRALTFDAEANLYVVGTQTDTEHTSSFEKAFAIKYSQNKCNMTVQVQLSLPPYAMKVGEQVRTTADFGDYTALTNAGVRWSWGDGDTSVSYTLPGNPRITGEHRYNEAGIHTIGLDFSQSCLLPVSDAYQQQMVVFDPEAGHVSGAGLFNSPAGTLSLMRDGSTSAYAFAARYTNSGADAKPAGAALFALNSSTLLFSNSLDWLVVNGNRAALQGTGTVNGQGRYKFVATVEDGKGGGINDPADKFRLQVWDLNAHGRLVYDNHDATDQRLSLTQPLEKIAAGQILINSSLTDQLFAQHLQQALAAQAPPTEISAYPNPFSSKATITFALDQSGSYTIDLYDLKGALVKKVAMGTATSQETVTVEVDGSSLSKGIYLARLQTVAGVQTVKLVLEK